jgi:hypothetical protein
MLFFEGRKQGGNVELSRLLLERDTAQQSVVPMLSALDRDPRRAHAGARDRSGQKAVCPVGGRPRLEYSRRSDRDRRDRAGTGSAEPDLPLNPDA